MLKLSNSVWSSYFILLHSPIIIGGGSLEISIAKDEVDFWAGLRLLLLLMQHIWMANFVGWSNSKFSQELEIVETHAVPQDLEEKFAKPSDSNCAP